MQYLNFTLQPCLPLPLSLHHVRLISLLGCDAFAAPPSQERNKPGGTIKCSGRAWLPFYRCVNHAKLWSVNASELWFLEAKCKTAMRKGGIKTHQPGAENHHYKNPVNLSQLLLSSCCRRTSFTPHWWRPLHSRHDIQCDCTLSRVNYDTFSEDSWNFLCLSRSLDCRLPHFLCPFAVSWIYFMLPYAHTKLVGRSKQPSFTAKSQKCGCFPKQRNNSRFPFLNATLIQSQARKQHWWRCSHPIPG